MRIGVVLALLSALAFGLTTPFIARTATSPFATAALLYAGAATAASLFRLVTARAGAPLARQHIGRLIAAGVIGAALAPTLLAWGLTKTGGVTGSLLLCSEPVFTALLAWHIFAEPVGRQFGVALALMVVAGALLVAPGGQTLTWGSLAIVGATLCWGVDNTISRALAEQDPLAVVAWKGLIGVVITAPFALAGAMPSLVAFATLLACGAVGYGLSLRLYLEAQRRIGAGRTASVFAIAPFVGAVVGLALGEAAPPLRTAIAAALFACAVWLHLTERHGHHHHHDSLDHEHTHEHDDGHHTHTHDPPVVGAHSHPHHHDATEHTHEHAPDLHHAHRH